MARGNADRASPVVSALTQAPRGSGDLTGQCGEPLALLITIPTSDPQVQCRGLRDCLGASCLTLISVSLLAKVLPASRLGTRIY